MCIWEKSACLEHAQCLGTHIYFLHPYLLACASSLLPPVGTHRCRYPSLQGRVYFCACQRPSARNRSVEEPCSEQLALPRCSWLPHTGSCCSEAPLQPAMHDASVRCSSILNNPLIELSSSSLPFHCLQEQGSVKSAPLLFTPLTPRRY